MLNGLDLFSGIGGISYALQQFIEPVAYCEIDKYCQSVLLSRMADGSIKRAPIWDDIQTFPCAEFLGHVDIIYGGIPCQGFSIAGVKKGLADKRSALTYDFLRVVREIKPQFVFIENVPQIIKIGGIEIVKNLNEMGMDCRWACISAASCGAPHKRDRWFLLAYNNSQSSSQTNKKTKFESSLRDTWLRYSRCYRKEISPSYWKETKCEFFGMDNGIPNELDRAKSLGNSVVPQQVLKAFTLLMGIENE